ncbi:MAG: hypothetical protein HC850_03250 [Rhodomicrobium sp.]|nr:hypothetical protein [Rhodomicrobium sp.]
MTAATGIPHSPAARPAGSAINAPAQGGDDGVSDDPGELAAFSELFAHLEIEAEQQEQPDAPAPEQQLKQPDAEDSVAAGVLAAMNIEMTHHQWFGAPEGEAAEDPLPRRNLPVIILKPDAGPDAGIAEKTPAPMPPFALSGLSDPSQAEVNAAATAGAHSLNGAAAAGPSSSPAQPNPTLAQPAPSKPVPATPTIIKPEDIAETLARVQAAKSANQASPAAAPEAETPNPDAPLPTHVKESLSALESVLSGSNARDKGDQRSGSEGRPFDPALIKEARIAAIRQETHLAEGFVPSAIAQIAERVQREMRPDSLQSSLQAYLAPRQEAQPPLRVLHLQLDPPQLGPVTIRLSLKDTALSLQLEAQSHETASLIHKDREALFGLLRSAGYTVDGFQIQTAGADRGMTGQPFGNQAGFGQAARRG